MSELHREFERDGTAFVAWDDARVPRDFGDAEEEVRFAAEGASVVDMSALGILHVRGPDAADFLHRLTTNDFRSLEPGRGLDAAFVTGKGRILHHVLAFRLAHEILVVNRRPGLGALPELLDRFRFTEQVEFVDGSRDRSVLLVLGRRASAVVSAALGASPEHLPMHALPEAVGPEDAWVAPTFPIAGGGILVLVPTARALPAYRRLRECGARPTGRWAYDHLRIAEGHPEPGRELTEDHNPLEAGLRTGVRFDKGCYVGQEVLARVENYDRLTRRLVRLEILEGTARAGDDIRFEGRRAGTVTSVSPLAAGPGQPALGYAHREAAGAGTILEVDSPREDPTSFRVVGPAGFFPD
jgi:folate-binding protein YgfZ